MKKKRFVKLCMSMGCDRNTSNKIAKTIIKKKHSHEYEMEKIEISVIENILFQNLKKS